MKNNILNLIIVSTIVVVTSCKLAGQNASNQSASRNYKPDIKNFPKDAVVLPAHLENMRAGQIRDALAQKATCLLPVGTLETAFNTLSLGNADAMNDSLLQLAKRGKTVIAPPIWYTPTGYILNSAENGTFDISIDAFTLYLESVMNNLVEMGFVKIKIVVLNNSKGENSPLFRCARFAAANMFNNLWKRPDYGKCWWIDTLRNTNPVWSYYSVVSFTSPTGADNSKKNDMVKPMRLESMTPEQTKNAVKRNLICFVPSGVIENHGNQNPVGCDAIEAETPLLLAATQADAVIAPTIWYGPTGYAVTGTDLGTINIDGDIYRNYVSGVLYGLTEMGFKKINIIQVHQGQSGTQWGSTDLAVQECQVRYSRENPHNAGVFTEPASYKIMNPPLAVYDHAGKNETSWMLYYRPEYTDISLIHPNDYMFCWEKGNESKKATFEWGKTMSDRTVNELVQMINWSNGK